MDVSGLDAYPQTVPNSGMTNRGIPNHGMMMRGALGIAQQAKNPQLEISLLFAAGRRPASDTLAQMAGDSAAVGGFTISHQPPIAEGWVELLASGLTFDLKGLAPMHGQPVPDFSNRFGFKTDYRAEPVEAVLLRPGPHISGGQHLLPVVRAMAGLTAALATIPGISGLCWHPARSIIEPSFFIRSIGAWLKGGAFPALGLTALNPTIDGGLLSEGLAFFTGQELRIEPVQGSKPAKPADMAKFAIRLIHTMVESGPLHDAWETADDQGHRFRLEPSANGKFVRVWRLF